MVWVFRLLWNLNVIIMMLSDARNILLRNFSELFSQCVYRCSSFQSLTFLRDHTGYFRSQAVHSLWQETPEHKLNMCGKAWVNLNNFQRKKKHGPLWSISLVTGWQLKEKGGGLAVKSSWQNISKAFHTSRTPKWTKKNLTWASKV